MAYSTQMISRIPSLVSLTALVALSAFVTGCASTVISNDKIIERTAIALSLDRNAFTISNRSDESYRSNYVVTVNDGRKYNCYIGGGAAGFMGASSVISDAMCNVAAGSAGAAGKPVVVPAPNCNALLKAAGRC
jgi:hypothetical protein